MKRNLPFIYLLTAVFFIIAFAGCSKVGIKEPVTLDKAAGKWSINSIRMQIYNGGTVAKDSLVPWKPVVENYVTFDGVSKLNYCFNSSSTKDGEYSFIGSDSIDIRLGSDNRRWKIMLLTPTNFNVQTTSNNNNSFPGATVITFQGFVR